jgi:DNA mismatch repair protein MutL
MIKILSEELINKIAAGEVVERPASVVKELVENSIDAGASHISVEIISGGSKLIRVTDDGMGMSQKDAELCFSRHATSKISSEEDLHNIVTMGFRGEALPAMASVSLLEMVSKRKEDNSGTEICLEGGVVKQKKEVGTVNGTSVIVRELFYNTPARKKFMKSVLTETRHIIDLVTNFALAYPEISFELFSDKKRSLVFKKADALSSRIAEVLGEKRFSQMLKIDEPGAEFSFYGWMGKPEIARNRAEVWFFVNQRNISSRTLVHAVQSAYADFLPQGKFPQALIYISINPHLVDVNVHPTKREVRFYNEKMMHDSVFLAVKKSLSSSRVVAVYSLNKEELFQTEKGRISQVKEGIEEYFARGKKEVAEQKEISFAAERKKEQSPKEEKPPLGMANLWQLSNMYILAQVKDSLVVLDQHAAHERILYEQALKNVNQANKGSSQRLLFPLVVELSPAEYFTWENNFELLEKLGFETKPFGGKSVLLTALPSALKNKKEEEFFKQILDDLEERLKSTNDKIKAVAESFACHTAVKAGDKLSLEEMNSLFDQLFSTQEPYFCPHGRPTIVRIPLEELSKKFGR